MEFVHTPYEPGKTIAAIATPLGEGGVAVIRISGKDALLVASKVFSGPIQTYKTHTIHYGYILDSSQKRVDDVLAAVFLGTRSYTGEDTVEIYCHGGAIITRRVLEVILKAGASAAKPGEFTFKAFMNGKLDLAQAEAVQELIGAKNELALDAAESQLQGKLSAKIASFQKELFEVAAILEAWVDFPEEGLEFALPSQVCQTLELVLEKMRNLLNTFHDGRIVRTGVLLCLAGSPNVGKSSLMNALLDKDRAIVSDIPGTTRDIIEESIRLNGLNLRLIDTAGIRLSDEAIEQEGIRRSKNALKEADLVLLVLDASRDVSQEETALIQSMPKGKTIMVWNKADLPHGPLPSFGLPYVVKISAKEKQGLEELHKMIDAVIWSHGPPSEEEVMITSLRHREALAAAISFCEAVKKGLEEDISPEFISFDMRQCLLELGKIIGTNITEDILSSIFSKFCIGK